MRRLAYFGAFLCFVVIYLIAALGSGYLLAVYASYQAGEAPVWWATHGIPFVLTTMAGWLGAFVASAAVGGLFPTLRLKPIAWAFVAVLAAQWLGNSLLVMSSARVPMTDIQGVIMALVAAGTAVAMAMDRDRQMGL